MHFLRQAYELAARSPDESSQNGAVIFNGVQTIAEGYNRPLNGIKPIQERPLKYRVFEHAERYAIISAWAKVTGAVMYCPWAACCDCARAIILSGISTLVVHYERMLLTPDHWKEDVDFALKMLSDSHVSVLYYHGQVKDAPAVLINGKLWNPSSCNFE